MHAAAGSERWTHLETAEQMRHSNRIDFYIFRRKCERCLCMQPHCHSHDVKVLWVVVFFGWFLIIIKQISM